MLWDKEPKGQFILIGDNPKTEQFRNNFLAVGKLVQPASVCVCVHLYMYWINVVLKHSGNVYIIHSTS